ncbi:MAG: PEP-CTERM sorting domain-containing protein [Alphaproteobacteria bacterium]|nr:PEP-CTERM sorting domain-containing protein [Alphaproteobacteria bacterium]
MNLKRYVTGAAIAAAVAMASSQAFALTIGNNDGGNCYPFSCGPSDGLTQYQEAYNSSAFSGPLSFDQVSFGLESPGPMDSGTYTVSFYLSTGPFNSLSSNMASNEGTFLGTLGTFNIGGTMPTTLALTGSTINYDPSMGDLLMNVDISNGSALGGYNSFFAADYTGADVSRAWNSSTNGPSGSDTGALQTTFSDVAVPEPSTWAMLAFGLSMIGLTLGLRRKRTA